MTTLNGALGKDALSEPKLDEAFRVFWPKLDKALKKIASIKQPSQPQRSDRDIAEETLSIVRALLKDSRGPLVNNPYGIINYPGTPYPNQLAGYDQNPNWNNLFINPPAPPGALPESSIAFGQQPLAEKA